MNFEIKAQDKDGSVLFQGTATASEASLLLEVGINYLLKQGLAPILTGGRDENSSEVDGTDTVQ